jgi:class 3 adenylate cyclase
VQSIHRGSEQWDKLLQPFVSDLVFQSIASRKYDNVLTFRPYTCHAAVLFVDLSGYSKITAAILSKGAHVLSASVNAYLTRLLEIIYDHGGDVLTFAGDALLAVCIFKNKI